MKTQLIKNLAIAFVSLTLISTQAVAQLALDFTGIVNNRFEFEATLGWSFTVNEPTAIDGLGFFDDDIGGVGLEVNHRVRLWRADMTLIAETTITNISDPVASSASGGRWLFNDIPTVVLPPGEYVIGADDPECQPGACDTYRFSSSAVTAPGIVLGDARSVSPNGFPFLSDTFRNDGYFGPNFRITELPTTCTLNMALEYASGVMTIDYTIGTINPAFLNIWLSVYNDIYELGTALPLPPVDPPVDVPVNIPLNNLGRVGILTTIVDQGGIQCSAWDTVFIP